MKSVGFVTWGSLPHRLTCSVDAKESYTIPKVPQYAHQDAPADAEPLPVEALALPIACSLTADELSQRGEELDTLFARAVDARERPDGYSFAFPAAPAEARTLLDFVLFERACCPFFTFSLAFPSPHTTVWLTVRGAEEAKSMLAAAYNMVRARAIAAER